MADTNQSMNEPPGRPGRGVLDPGSLAELRSLDPGGQGRLVERVLATYQTSMARLVEQMTRVRQDSDWDQVARVAHTLKSSSASVGALSLSSLCAEIERHLRQGDTAAAVPLLGRFDDEAARVAEAVRAMLGAGGA